jgi:hypothetical protein
MNFALRYIYTKLTRDDTQTQKASWSKKQTTMFFQNKESNLKTISYCHSEGTARPLEKINLITDFGEISRVYFKKHIHKMWGTV